MEQFEHSSDPAESRRLANEQVEDDRHFYAPELEEPDIDNKSSSNISDYLAMGFKAVLLKGYNHQANPKQDYKTAKEPVRKGFTRGDYKGMTLLEILEAEKRKYWIGWLVPPGLIVIDSEDPGTISLIDDLVRSGSNKPSIQRTNRGKQYLFKYAGNDIPAASEYICAGGFPVTPRIALKNYVIMPPTNGRTWEKWTPHGALPGLLSALEPYNPKDKIHVARCLSWAVGEAYRKGSLAGYDDLDAGFMDLLLSCNIPEAQIHEAYSLIFLNDYDERRTEVMLRRTQERKEKGESLHGAGSLIKGLKDKGLDEIAGHVKKLQRMANIFDDDDDSDLLKILKEGEVGIAKHLTMLWKNKLRYDTREGRWYQWGSHCWSRISDECTLESFEPLRTLLDKKAVIFAEKKINAMGRDKQKADQFEAYEKSLINALKTIGDVSRRSEILKMCRSEGSYLGFNGAWDEHPYLIACTNGVLNIDTLDFCDGNPGDNVRTSIPIEWNPDAKCPTWEDALFSIFDGNEDVLDYFQRVLGYCISGLNIHHFLWIWEGKGRNGKGLIYRALHHVLSGFITYVDRELLLERKHGRQSGSPAPDVPALYGKRMAFMVETTENRKFDPGKMKWLTGGDIVSARGMYAKDITQFKSTAKLHLLTNFRPHISGGDYAAWQRIILIPFPLSFVLEPSADASRNERQAVPRIEEKIQGEASGILAWLVRGYRKYKTRGINSPACIKEATKEYHKEEDTVGRFVEEKLETYMGNLLPAGEWYRAYNEWCEDQDLHPKHNTTFGREMWLHIEVTKKGNKAFYVNTRIKG